MKGVAAVVIRIVVAFPAVGSGAYAPMPVARMVKHVFSQSIIPRVFVQLESPHIAELSSSNVALASTPLQGLVPFSPVRM